MGVINSQNWDSVTAPAIPAGWSVNPSLEITTLASGSSPTPISTPNVLNCGSATYATIVFGSEDGNAGNVVLQFTGIMGSSPSQSVSGCAFSGFVRASSSPLIYASDTFYEFQLNGNTGAFNINSVVSGTSTNLLSVSTSSLAPDVWYQLTATANGTSLSCTVVRVTDGDFLQSNGTFASGANTFQVTSSSISGEGFYGWGAIADGSDNVYGDNLTLSTIGIVAPFGPPPVARIVNELDPEPGRIVALSNTNLPPPPQFSSPHKLYIQGFDLQPEDGRSISRVSRTLSVPGVAIRRIPVIEAREDPADVGATIALRAFPQPTVQSRPALPTGVSQAPSQDQGSVIHAGAFPSIPALALARPQRQAMREELTPDAGATVTAGGAKFVDLRTATKLLASGVDLAPFAGQVIYAEGTPPEPVQSKTPKRAIAAQLEIPAEQGSATARHGQPSPVAFGPPPDAFVARYEDLPSEQGRSTSLHGTKAFDASPGHRLMAVAIETTVDPGSVITEDNLTARIFAQPPQASRISRSEPLLDAGGVLNRHAPAILPQSAPQRRSVIVTGSDLPPELGNTVRFANQGVPFSDVVSYVDPDLASLVIDTTSGVDDVDPDLANEVID